jgi:hypothetical protein
LSEDVETIKHCNRCNKELPLAFFYAVNKDGHYSICRICVTNTAREEHANKLLRDAMNARSIVAGDDSGLNAGDDVPSELH